MIVLRSRQWETYAGFSHGFTTRSSGFSEGPYASLNLGRSTDDDPARVEANWQKLCGAAEISAGDWLSAHQIHSDRIIWVEDPLAFHSGAQLQADGIVTLCEGKAACVRMADCVPVLLVSRKARIAAAVHAGWRGTVQGIAAKAAREMRSRCREADDWEALIGPSIGPCCFAVEPGVAARFDPRFVLPGTRPRVDLWRANAVQLMESGFKENRISVAEFCTVCHPDLFYSHRRDNGVTGRMIAWAGWRPPIP